jgi:hypothetical protein
MAWQPLGVPLVVDDHWLSDAGPKDLKVDRLKQVLRVQLALDEKCDIRNADVRVTEIFLRCASSNTWK